MRITAVDVKGTFEPTVRQFRVTKVTVTKGSRYVPFEQAAVSPGSTVKVRVALASFKNLMGSRTVDLTLKAPRSMPREGVSLVFDAGYEFDTLYLTAPSYDVLLKESQTTGRGSSVRLSLQLLNQRGEAVPGRAPLASAKASLPAAVRVHRL